MKRRSFLQCLAALPIVGPLLHPTPPPDCDDPKLWVPLDAGEERMLVPGHEPFTRYSGQFVISPEDIILDSFDGFIGVAGAMGLQAGHRFISETHDRQGTSTSAE